MTYRTKRRAVWLSAVLAALLSFALISPPSVATATEANDSDDSTTQDVSLLADYDFICIAEGTPDEGVDVQGEVTASDGSSIQGYFDLNGTQEVNGMTPFIFGAAIESGDVITFRADDPDVSVPAPYTVQESDIAGLCETEPTDTDGDGVPDSSDQCPDTPANTDVDDTGCEVDDDNPGNSGAVISIEVVQCEVVVTSTRDISNYTVQGEDKVDGVTTDTLIFSFDELGDATTVRVKSGTTTEILTIPAQPSDCLEVNDDPPFVRVTFICLANQDGVVDNTGTDQEFAAGDYIFRIREEAGVSTDYAAGVGGSGLWSGTIGANETIFVSTTSPIAGVSVTTSPVANDYNGTASTNETACSQPPPPPECVEQGEVSNLHNKLRPGSSVTWEGDATVTIPQGLNLCSLTLFRSVYEADQRNPLDDQVFLGNTSTTYESPVPGQTYSFPYTATPWPQCGQDDLYTPNQGVQVEEDGTLDANGHAGVYINSDSVFENCGEETEDTVQVFTDVVQCVPNVDGTAIGAQVFIDLFAPESNEETVTVNLDLGDKGAQAELAPGEYDNFALFVSQGETVTIRVQIGETIVDEFEVTAQDCELGDASATASEQCVDELNIVTVSLLTENGDVSPTYVTEVTNTNVTVLEGYLDIFTPNVGEEDTFNTFTLEGDEYIVVRVTVDTYDGEPTVLIDNQRFDGATCVDEPEEPKEPTDPEEPKPEPPTNPEPRPEPDTPDKPEQPTPDNPQERKPLQPDDGDSMDDLAVVSQDSPALSGLGLALSMLLGGFVWSLTLMLRRRTMTTS